MPQTWPMLHPRVPASGEIPLVRPPLIEVTSLTYYDAADVEQSLAVSPAEFNVVSSGHVAKAIVKPLTNEMFPATSERPDAVTVTFRAGFESPDDSGTFQIIKAGIVLMASELYKQRTLSVPFQMQASPLKLSQFW